MTGFEPRTSGIRSDRSTNWATTTAWTIYFLRHIYLTSRPYFTPIFALLVVVPFSITYITYLGNYVSMYSLPLYVFSCRNTNNQTIMHMHSFFVSPTHPNTSILTQWKIPSLRHPLLAPDVFVLLTVPHCFIHNDRFYYEKLHSRRNNQHINKNISICSRVGREVTPLIRRPRF